jgi:hypothetical protein
MGQLHPYLGLRTREHRPGAEGALATYGTDRSGTCSYRFNRLGFRGEDYDPQADFHLFACGCSFTVGTGLEEAQTWPAVLGASLGPGVNVLNFAEEGASNDYIARTLITQCAAVKPDLAVAMFTNAARVEAFGGGRALPLHPLYAQPGTEAAMLGRFEASSEGPPEDVQALMQDLRDKAEGYYTFYEEAFGVMNMVRNMLLLQLFCRSRGIPLLMTGFDAGKLRAYATDPLIAPMIELLDADVFVPFDYRDLVDKAADGTHPGPESNARFAARLARGYRGSAQQRNPVE